MKLYADTPGRRLTQLLADGLFVMWLVTWVWVGNVIHDGTMALAEPGRQTSESATALAEGLTSAGDALREVPLVGDGVAAPFDKASDASYSLAQAGRNEVKAVERLAWWLGISIALIPILVVAGFFLPLRWRFVRRATAGARFIDASEDLDLFALRALANQPMHVLAGISDDPAGAWRRRDPVVIEALGRLELKASGLKLR